MTLRIVVCHISFLKFEYFTQRRGEAEYAEVFATQILIITLRSRPLSALASLGGYAIVEIAVRRAGNDDKFLHHLVSPCSRLIEDLRSVSRG